MSAQVRSTKRLSVPFSTLLRHSKTIQCRSHFKRPCGVDATLERVAATPERRPSSAPGLPQLWPQLAKLGLPRLLTREYAPASRQASYRSGCYGKDPRCWPRRNRSLRNTWPIPASVDPALGQTALSIAARNGNADCSTKLQNVYETSTNATSSRRELRLLAQFEDPPRSNVHLTTPSPAGSAIRTRHQFSIVSRSMRAGPDVEFTVKPTGIGFSPS